MSQHAKITLSSIAQKANLSISSVSRVLRTPHLTSAATQASVFEAIKSLNINLEDLFNNYKFAPPMKTVLLLDNQLFPLYSLYHAIEESLKKRGYKILYWRLLEVKQHDIFQIINFIIKQSFNAVLVINEAPYLKDLHRYNHLLPPILLINHFSLDFPSLYFDHLSIGYQITENLIDRGHKNIAFLLGNENKLSNKQLIKGYQHALLQAKLPLNQHYIIYNSIHYHHGKNAIKNLMMLSPTPTALIIADNICLNYADKEGVEKGDKYKEDENLINNHQYNSLYTHIHGAIAGCNEMKIAIPTALSLIYFNHQSEKQYNELDRLSEVNKPLHKMGEKAVELLFKILHPNSQCSIVNQQIETKTIFRYAIE